MNGDQILGIGAQSANHMSAEEIYFNYCQILLIWAELGWQCRRSNSLSIFIHKKVSVERQNCFQLCGVELLYILAIAKKVTICFSNWFMRMQTIVFCASCKLQVPGAPTKCLLTLLVADHKYTLSGRRGCSTPPYYIIE